MSRHSRSSCKQTTETKTLVGTIPAAFFARQKRAPTSGRSSDTFERGFIPRRSTRRRGALAASLLRPPSTRLQVKFSSRSLGRSGKNLKPRIRLPQRFNSCMHACTAQTRVCIHSREGGERLAAIQESQHRTQCRSKSRSFGAKKRTSKEGKCRRPLKVSILFPCINRR